MSVSITNRNVMLQRQSLVLFYVYAPKNEILQKQKESATSVTPTSVTCIGHVP